MNRIFSNIAGILNDLRRVSLYIKTEGENMKSSDANIKKSGANVKSSGANVKSSEAKVKSSGANVKSSEANVKKSGANVSKPKANIRRFFSSKLYHNADIYLHYSNSIIFYADNSSPVINIILVKLTGSGITGTVTVIIITTCKPVIFYLSFNEAILSFDGVIERYCGVPP